jgi:hypothetical protein
MQIQYFNNSKYVNNCFIEEWILFTIMAQLLLSIALDQCERLHNTSKQCVAVCAVWLVVTESLQPMSCELEYRWLSLYVGFTFLWVTVYIKNT